MFFILTYNYYPEITFALVAGLHQIDQDIIIIVGRAKVESLRKFVQSKPDRFYLSHWFIKKSKSSPDDDFLVWLFGGGALLCLGLSIFLAFSGEDAEMVFPEVDHHFIQLPLAIDIAQQLHLDVFGLDNVPRTVECSQRLNLLRLHSVR